MLKIIPDCDNCVNHMTCLEKGYTGGKYPVYCLEIKNGDEIVVTTPGIVTEIFRPPE